MSAALEPEIHQPTSRASAIAGVIIIMASILCVAAVAHHPTADSHNAADLVVEIGQKATIDGIVHGTLIVLLGLLLYAFWHLTALLDSGWARAGLIAYGVGYLAMVSAATIDGFVIPNFVAHYAGRPAADLETMRHILTLCGVTLRVWSRIGVLAVATAIALWSIDLAGRAGWIRVIGILGCVTGAGLAIGLLSGHLRMTVHGILGFTLAQILWNAAVGVLLIQRRI